MSSSSCYRKTQDKHSVNESKEITAVSSRKRQAKDISNIGFDFFRGATRIAFVTFMQTENSTACEMGT